MKRKLTEGQIVAAIKKQENGIAVKEICRELSISDATFYNWTGQSTEAWKWVIQQRCGSWKKRIQS